MAHSSGGPLETQELPSFADRLTVRSFRNDHGHGFDLLRTDCEPHDIVAVVLDGVDRGVGEAERYAELLALSPIMLTLLTEALEAWSGQFDSSEDEDLSISGADLIDWFAAWRLRVRNQLSRRSDN